MPIVTAIILDAGGTPAAGQYVTFRPIIAPLSGSASVQTGEDIRAIIHNEGGITQTLAPGEYFVWTPSSVRRRILVPDEDATFDLDDLLGHPV